MTDPRHAQPRPPPDDAPFLRQVKSYVLRAGRTTAAQAKAYEVYGPRFLLDYAPTLPERARELLPPTDDRLVPFSEQPLIASIPEFPAGAFDLDGQQVDLRDQNSWRLLLSDVSTAELLEVHLVNAVAPFLLVRDLKPLMKRSPAGVDPKNTSKGDGSHT